MSNWFLLSCGSSVLQSLTITEWWSSHSHIIQHNTKYSSRKGPIMDIKSPLVGALPYAGSLWH